MADDKKPEWLVALEAQRVPAEEKAPEWLIALDAQRSKLEKRPGRRPLSATPKTLGELYAYARELTPLALATLQEVMEHGRSEAARVLAANSLMDRAWGKPITPVEHGGTVTIADGAREKLASLLAKIVESKTMDGELIQGELIQPKAELIQKSEIIEDLILGPPPPGEDDP